LSLDETTNPAMSALEHETGSILPATSGLSPVF
jgi:hypothetical protein